MKSILIIRHAKSSWEFTDLDDFERPLNERGKNDAPEMAHRLLKERIKIDAFISSPAKRAKKTAQLFIYEFKRNKEEIIYMDILYNASADVFYKVIGSMDEAFDSIAIFSHNPGVTDFVNTLTDVRIDNIPTCGIFGVRVHMDNWADFEKAKKDFWFFNYPKLKSS